VAEALPQAAVRSMLDIPAEALVVARRAGCVCCARAPLLRPRCPSSWLGPPLDDYDHEKYHDYDYYKNEYQQPGHVRRDDPSCRFLDRDHVGVAFSLPDYGVGRLSVRILAVKECFPSGWPSSRR